MGVRIEFPLWAHNASATIEPPFDIPAYEPLAQVDDQGNLQEPTDEEKTSGKGRFEDGYGVVRNTGVIKSIAVNTYGMNFPHGLYVLIRNEPPPLSCISDCTSVLHFRRFLGNP